MTLYVIRHGQSGENSGLTANNDSALTDLGRRQAQHTGTWLASSPDRNPLPKTILVSPALRTLETALPIAEACGAQLVADPDLCESGMLYDDEGLTAREIREIAPGIVLPDHFQDSAGWATPWNGETRIDLIARVERTLERLVRTHPPGSEPIALVSHAHFSGFLAGRMFAIPAEVLSQHRLRLFNCGVSRIDFAPGYRQMVFSNFTEHISHIETR